MKNSTLNSITAILLITLFSSCGGGVNVNEVVTPKASASDGGSAPERKMAALTRGHSQQKRSSLVWDSRLAKVARARANDMGQRGYFDHTDPDGHGPNWHVTRSGYRLPIKWTAFDKANQVESILAGHASPEAAFATWLDSSQHATHLLGRSLFYQNQTRYGIGYAHIPNSTYKHYWVFLSAPPET